MMRGEVPREYSLKIGKEEEDSQMIPAGGTRAMSSVGNNS
jgi:hypothetical protein